MGDPASTTLPVVSVLTILTLPALAYFRRAVRWPAEVQRLWYDKSEQTHAGLNARAQVELIRLHQHIEQQLDPGGVIDPLSYVTDPDPLVRQARLCAELLATRDRVRRHVIWYRRLGWPQPFLVAAYVIGMALLIIRTLGRGGEWMTVLGLCLVGLTVLVALVIGILFLYFESRLTRADVMSQQGQR